MRIPGPRSGRRAVTPPAPPPSEHRSPADEGRHDVAPEPPELFQERGRPHPFGPMQHELVEAWVLRLVLSDQGDAVGGRSHHPGLLLDALPDRRRPGWRPRRAPGAAFGVRVADEPEGGEPLVPLVVGRLDLPDGRLSALRHVEAETEAQVLAQLQLATVTGTGVSVGV